MPVIPLTLEEIKAGLQSGFSLDETDQFTFSIPDADSFWETTSDNYEGSNQQPFDASYSVFNTTQADAFRVALALWDELIQPNFTEVADTAVSHGEVRIAFTSVGMGGSTAGYAFQGSNQTPTSIVGDIWINANNTATTFAEGSQDWSTLLHEIGHVLGLKHPFEPTVLDPAYDDTRYTVMSYTAPYAVLITPTGGGGYSINWDVVTPLTPSVLDIRAIQDTYGADPTTRTGDDTYVLDFLQTDITFRSIYDAGGTDTIDFRSVTRDSVVDLTPGAMSSIAAWTEAQQVTFYANLTGDTEANIQTWFDGGPTPNAYYEWTDNLGIAFGTTIENVIAGAGNDTIAGNDADNLFRLEFGGNDIASGGIGDDGFYFGAALTAADSVDGGAGTNDQVGLQGDYSAGLTLGAANLVGIEALVLLPGNDTRFGDTAGNFYDFWLTTVDANVAAGQQLTVNWNTLRAGEDVTFHGGAETDGSFLTYGGQGSDVITGGAASDGFYFGGTDRWSASDAVSGGGGADDQLGLQGNYTGASAITFGIAQIEGIETLVLLTGGDARFGAPAGEGYSYDITTNNGNVAAGQTMTVNANTLRANQPGIADETLTFNGTAEFDGRFVIYGGAGGDFVIASAGADEIWGGAGADTLIGAVGADDLRGGAGNDSFVYGSAAQSTALSMDEIFDFTTGDQIVLFFDADTVNGGDQAFSFIGSAAFGNVPGQLRVSDLGGGVYQAEGDVNGDSVADIVISVTSDHPLTAADFVL